MRVLINNAHIYNTSWRKLVEGAVLVGLDETTGEGRILNLFPEARHSFAHLPTSDMKIDAEGADILPGFCDIHTHGRAKEDFNFSDIDGMKRAAYSYAMAGTTSLMPTLASAPFEELCASAEMIRSLKGKTGGADFMGVHLEGRYLNVAKRGAHNPDFIVPPSAEELERFFEASGLPLHISAALELDRDGFADRALSLGATLGLGHTNATYEEAYSLWEKYGVSFTHLYNTMPQIHHREGGAATAALMSNGFCELICDGMHSAPHMVNFTYKIIGLSRLVLISDSMAAAGAPDGEFLLAGSPAIVENGIARTPDGALAGSTLDLRRAVENLAKFCNISICDAIVAATANPAAEVGVSNEVGEIKPGARADLLFTHIDEKNKKIDISRVFVNGREIKK